ncbi:hypothetical protein PSTT_05165 [Puccinia striiformis]|uniref:Uncharacterized protein n=1 Tax=Puccinia striiformis TaxID=27350 RepID=A0A2S4VQ23_9BASI|nr:hypothetical protein PSTT_05165 [Puccinia striiformis]
MVPTRIWLSYKQSPCSVQTKELDIVEDLVDAVQKRFSRSLRDFDLSDISLHTPEDAETPLIVKVNPNVAPETFLPVNGIPTRICLSFKKCLLSVQTKELDIVEDLMDAVQKRFWCSLRDFNLTDISLHTTEDAEALDSASTLAEIAGRLSPCSDPKTPPLIVKVNPNAAPVTSLTVNGIPTTICLSSRKRLISVQTKELNIVQDLLDATQKQFPCPLRDFNTADISLHTTGDAEALTTDSKLAAIAAQLSPCGDPKTPLIVKAKSSIYDGELECFWKFLPEVELVTHSELEYLQLKEYYVLGQQKLGSRLLVRPIYQEFHQFFKTKAYDKIVVTGTPGVGKTVFAAFYMWIAATKQKTMVWKPAPTPETPTLTYMMTLRGVEVLNTRSDKLVHVLAKSDTIHIVDGQPPGIHNTWTLLVTSPQHHHYHQLRKEGGSKTLFMPPWSYNELKIGPAILYSDDETLPTALMDGAFEWFGGVPRYVFKKASAKHKAFGTVDTALAALLKELTPAILKDKLDNIIIGHQNGTSENYLHHVIHICSHPSGDLTDYHLLWASRQVESAMTNRYTQEIHTDIQNKLRAPPDGSNLRGLLSELQRRKPLLY